MFCFVLAFAYLATGTYPAQLKLGPVGYDVIGLSRTGAVSVFYGSGILAPGGFLSLVFPYTSFSWVSLDRLQSTRHSMLWKMSREKGGGRGGPETPIYLSTHLT